MLQQVIRVVYLIMRPLLAVAGAALDNWLVYGDWFYLRPSLWSMRQIMRNFANFALGAIFLIAILMNLVKWWAVDGKWSIKSILKNLLIATVLIQASWFGMGVLLDLSTAAIYSVGALPMNILKDSNTNLANVRFIKPNVKFSIDNTNARDGTDATHSVFYSCSNMPVEDSEGKRVWPLSQAWTKKKYFIPCRAEWWFLVPEWEAWEVNTWEDRKRKKASEWSSLSNEKGATPWSIIPDDRFFIYESISDSFCVIWNSIIQKDQYEDIVNEEDIENARLNTCSLQHKSQTEDWIAYLEAFQCTRLWSIINSATWMTWPMYTLYASIFRLSDIALTPNHKNVLEISLEFILKLAIWLALIIPLFTLAILLIIRAVVLRWFIIFMPLLVLAWVFGFSPEILGEKWKFNSLLSLIFMPVIAVFAISMSLIVLSLIWRIDMDPNFDPMAAMWIERADTSWYECKDGERRDVQTKGKVDCSKKDCGELNKYCYNVLNITSICFSDSQRIFGNWLLNIMTRLVVNMFGIWLMWMVVFAALKTGAITGGIAWSISWFASSLLKNIPLVPVPGLGMQSIWALQNTARQAWSLPNKIAQQQSTNIDKYFKNRVASSWTDKKTIDDSITKALKAGPGDDAKEHAMKAMKIANDTNYLQYDNFHKWMALAAWVGGTQLEGINNFSDAIANDNVWRDLVEGEWWWVENLQEKINKWGLRSDEVWRSVRDALIHRAQQQNNNFSGHENNGADWSQWYYDNHSKKLIKLSSDNKISSFKTNDSNLTTDKLKTLMNETSSGLSLFWGFNSVGLERFEWIDDIVHNRHPASLNSLTQNTDADIYINASGNILQTEPTNNPENYRKIKFSNNAWRIEIIKLDKAWNTSQN